MTEYKSIQELLYALCSCIAIDVNGQSFIRTKAGSGATGFKAEDIYIYIYIYQYAFNNFLSNASENGRLFIPWKLQSVITCPDTWECYAI